MSEKKDDWRRSFCFKKTPSVFFKFQVCHVWNQIPIHSPIFYLCNLVTLVTDTFWQNLWWSLCFNPYSLTKRHWGHKINPSVDSQHLRVLGKGQVCFFVFPLLLQETPLTFAQTKDFFQVFFVAPCKSRCEAQDYSGKSMAESMAVYII